MSKEERFGTTEEAYALFRENALNCRPQECVGGGEWDELWLVDIYDYAADNGDDFTCLEVLCYAARHCPDSEDLMCRRRYFHYGLGSDKELEQLLSHLPEKSLLDRILEVQVTVPSGQSCQAELEALLRSVNHAMSDEEVIRFVTAGRRPETVEWLFTVACELMSKSLFPDTAAHELLLIALDNEWYDVVERLAEHLTLEEPFEITYWIELANVRKELGKKQEALSAVEYALAIDPDDEDARMLYTVLKTELEN